MRGKVYHARTVDDEADVRRIMAHPMTMIGSDGRLSKPGADVPHPRNYGTFPRVLGDGLVVMSLPAFILGGSVSGIFTPTEAGAITVLYVILVGLFAYRSLRMADLPKLLQETALDTASVMLMICAASAFGFYLAWERIPPQMAAWLVSLTQDPTMLLDVARRQAERGKDREADVLYRRLMNLRHEADPRLVARGMLGLAEMEHRFGRDDEARHLAGRVAALYISENAPVEVAEYRNEGMLEVALFQESIGDTLGMLATFRTLAEVDHRNALALHGYARAAVRTGIDLVPATRSAIRGVVYSDNDPDMIDTLAECYYWRGLYSKAIKWQKKAVAAAPHQALYRTRLNRYEAAKVADPHGMRGPPERIR